MYLYSTTECCSLSVPADVRAVSYHKRMYILIVSFERHGSQVISLQSVRWKGSSVLTSLSMVLKALLGVGYKRG